MLILPLTSCLSSIQNIWTKFTLGFFPIIEVYVDLMRVIPCLIFTTFTMIGILTIPILVTSESQYLLQWNEWVASVTLQFWYLMKLKCYLLYLNITLKGHMVAGEEKEDMDMTILPRRCTSNFTQKFLKFEKYELFPLLVYHHVCTDIAFTQNLLKLPWAKCGSLWHVVRPILDIWCQD